MALSIFKSRSEEPWDRFSHRMNRALETASAGFRQRHRRELRLGSPVKVSGADADIIRAPIEVCGGTREYAVAYLEAKDLDGKLDGRRLEAIARAAAEAAEPYAERPPDKPGDVVLTYP